MTEQAIDNIKKQLENQGKKLDEIRSTLQHMAVQDEQIKQIQREQLKMWEKIDTLVGSQGVISHIQQHQASCPRNQVKILWYVIIPMGLSQLALAAKLIEMIGV